MKIFGDYHTHTVYSHGTGTVLQNAEMAKQKGLDQIGISDHGFSHPFFGLKADKLPALKEDCKRAEDKYGVRVLVGIESNFTDSYGKCDLTEDYYDNFDIFLAGAHIFVNYKDFSSLWNIGILSPLTTAIGSTLDGKAKAYITDVYIKAVISQPIDVITHLDYRVFSNVVEVAHCCKEYGTYIEINTKKTHMTDEQWKAVYNTGVNFIIGSDAHSPDRVADFAPAFALMERVGIDSSRVHNLDRLPSFRFSAYKGGRI